MESLIISLAAHPPTAGTLRNRHDGRLPASPGNAADCFKHSLLRGTKVGFKPVRAFIKAWANENEPFRTLDPRGTGEKPIRLTSELSRRVGLQLASGDGVVTWLLVQALPFQASLKKVIVAVALMVATVVASLLGMVLIW